ncbi:hypothetical protein BJ322DRAFT_850843 [Thelephora terrestris]|uniref:BTB domain-containing protein n=1 Tax=Thelephora terrestris TaxID=56493 RepID=A0A9P6HD68_9AGAM|nr:hypothetical protein BJ322DRAFT_850843 [Thelephora terrestris]
MQSTALSFQSGAPPTARTSITTTLSGSFNIYGLIEMCKGGASSSGAYETPSIDHGRWQIQLVFNDPQFVELNFFAKQCPDELLDHAGNRKGTFEIAVSMVVGSSESNHTEGFRKYQPGPYVNAATGWSREYWLPKSVVLSKSASSPVTLAYTINERSEESWPSSPRTHSITSSTSSIHSIHSPHPTNPFLSTSPYFANTSPTLANPFVHNAFSSITASLFDDEETSNIVFIISEPPPGTRPSEFYSRSTKNTLGFSRNGRGASPDDSALGGGTGAIPASGRNSRASRIRGGREEYIYAHTKVLSARSEYFRNMFANKSAFNEVLNVTSIEEDLGSMPMGPGRLGSEITDDDFDDGDDDIASPRPPPSGVITPSESSIRSSDGALTATTVKRRVVRVSDTSYATYRAMLYFLYTGLYSFTPLTPPERRASRDLKDSASVAGSDALSEFDAAELTFTQSQHNLTLSNLNASTASTSSILSTGPVVAPTPLNASILGASVQRKDSNARLKRSDSGSVTGHALHHRESSSQLHSQFTSTSTGNGTGPTNPLTTSMTLATGFNLSQSMNLGTRPGLHLRSYSSPTGEGEKSSVPPVVGSGYGTVGDDVPKSNAKSVYKLCHRLEIPELKAAALEHIRCSLTPENVVTEICSPFTARFPEVRKIEREYLKANWANVKNTKAFGKLICKVFGDESEGVGEMWLDFFREL